MRSIKFAALCLFIFHLSMLIAFAQERPVNELQFTIKSFDVVGNTKLSNKEIETVVAPYTGKGKTAQDVESARTALEHYYHKQGYPTALVNIPEQTVESGTVTLEVIESNIRRVRVTGNRYFTMESILNKMPSFRPGEILYLPEIQEELSLVNSHPDLKVAPVLMPGKELGTIDVELKVKDKLPLHGSLELNNRATHNTTDMRLNALIRYDNLWQKEHSISLQYQTSPEDAKEVRALAASYVLPAFWNDDHILALYGVISDSEVAFGQGFQTVGKGYIVGLRDVIPLPAREKYTHSLSLGVDYKDFDDTLNFAEDETSEALETPLTYLPFSLNYNSALNHHNGISRFLVGFNMVMRGLVTDRSEFEDKRYKSRGNYIYTTIGLERYQNLPWEFQLMVKGDGQISDQPLPANEQYVAGGMKSVRGYKETEAAGDNAIHGTIELSYTALARILSMPEDFSMVPHIFYDIAALRLIDPLPGQDQPSTFAGTGAGIRGRLTRFLEYELSWGMALDDTDQTDRGDHQFYFVLTGKF